MPDKWGKYSVSPADVTLAIKLQNKQQLRMNQSVQDMAYKQGLGSVIRDPSKDPAEQWYQSPLGRLERQPGMRVLNELLRNPVVEGTMATAAIGDAIKGVKAIASGVRAAGREAAAIAPKIRAGAPTMSTEQRLEEMREESKLIEEYLIRKRIAENMRMAKDEARGMRMAKEDFQLAYGDAADMYREVDLVNNAGRDIPRDHVISQAPVRQRFSKELFVNANRRLRELLKEEDLKIQLGPVGKSRWWEQGDPAYIGVYVKGINPKTSNPIPKWRKSGHLGLSYAGQEGGLAVGKKLKPIPAASEPDIEGLMMRAGFPYGELPQTDWVGLSKYTKTGIRPGQAIYQSLNEALKETYGVRLHSGMSGLSPGSQSLWEDFVKRGLAWKSRDVPELYGMYGAIPPAIGAGLLGLSMRER